MIKSRIVVTGLAWNTRGAVATELLKAARPVRVSVCRKAGRRVQLKEKGAS